MTALNPNILLELHAAAAPFLRAGEHCTAARRQRLRQAVAAVLKEGRIALPPDQITKPYEALDALRAVIDRCTELRVQWPDVVAIVNREETL